MLNPDWKPAMMADTEAKWGPTKIPAGLSAQDAEGLMFFYLEVREDWLHHFVNATYYLDKAEFRYDTAYQVAYMRAGQEDKATEKHKDTVAKNDPKVVLARMDLMVAKAAVVEAKAKLEGCTLAHHSVKKVLDKMAEERYL